MTQPREPINISGAEFIEPPPEIAAHFSETFAQARARVAREQAEAEGSVSNMESFESTEALEDISACPQMRDYIARSLVRHALCGGRSFRKVPHNGVHHNG